MEAADQVGADCERRGNSDCERPARPGGAHRKRKPSVQKGQCADAEQAAGKPPEREVEPEREAGQHERDVGGGTEGRDLDPHRRSFRQHGVAPANRVGEDELQPSRILFARERTCARADRECDREAAASS